MSSPKFRPKTLFGVVNVRLTVEEKEFLRENARNAGLSLSAFVRRRSFGRPVVAYADAVMLRELRRLGGLIKHIHNESSGAYSKETSAVLLTLQSYIKKLIDDRSKTSSEVESTTPP